jgi:hypothetical protein
LKLLLQVLRNQVLQDLLPDVTGELFADDRSRGLTGTEAWKFGALLDIGDDTRAFGVDLRDGNGDLQRMPATFNSSQVDVTSRKEIGSKSDDSMGSGWVQGTLVL